MATKNLGQVAGVHISTTPPENKILLWYDDTPSQRVHKVWDKGLNQWVVLNKNNVSSITYSELVGLATNTGLSIQSWYKITDKGNLLALAITTTKVQYHDPIGNILIDDLGSNIQYHVTSSNLLVDDVAGVFDNVNKKLVFQFSEHNPDFTADDYILGKVKRGNVWSLAKYKISTFLSKVTGNSITWNGGFFFNFNNALSNVLDKEGGVVSKQTHDNTVANLNRSINNVGSENQNIIQNANTAITAAVEDVKIYDKKTPALQTGGEPIDVATGDKLITIISKFQRWINKFKFATGIRLSTGFKTHDSKSNINNNDTVESALSKLKKYVDLHEYSENITVSEEEFMAVTSRPDGIKKEDTVERALAKLLYLVNNVSKAQLEDSIIDFSKIAKKGVLPTDILRIDLQTTFDFTGCGFGGVAIQGYSRNMFATDSDFPYSNYRLSASYGAYGWKILSFIPVVPVIPNNTNQYANAGSLVHYRGGDITVQFLYQLSKTRRDELWNSGKRYLKATFSADIYGVVVDEQTLFIDLYDYVQKVNLNLSSGVVAAGTESHIILKVKLDPKETNS